MKQILETALQHALHTAFPEHATVSIQVDRTKDPRHGDFATNLAMLLAKPCGKSPMVIAQALVAALPAHANISKVAIAPPGFINFYMHAQTQTDVVARILQEQDRFGHCNQGQGERVFLEYVSSNPTGPLHVGHGRGAAFGASLANVLSACGYDVHREYYVNDAGRQMDILATSLWLRYLQAHGAEFAFPSNGYRGDYVLPMADALTKQVSLRLVHPIADVFQGIPEDELSPGVGNKEDHIDGLIVRAKALLKDDYAVVFNLALDTILADIKADLADFGVVFDQWFSEKSLVTSGAVEHALDLLRKHGYVYEKNTALWFASTRLGDDKDRCLVRENGQSTYFASDVAYLLNKFERGAQKLVYVFGADHHGYIPRLHACVEALGYDREKVLFEIVQFAVLYRGKERVQMSTRSGSFVTLRELREEVGNDAARFFYVLRKADQHMDFDLELAVSQSQDNPVYYVQYAHARICTVFKQLADKGLTWDSQNGLASLTLLDTAQDQALLRELNRYPEILALSASHREPHRLALYLRELAQQFHAYYNTHTFLVEDAALRNARLCLAKATAQVLKNALQLLGVSAPERMSDRKVEVH